MCMCSSLFLILGLNAVCIYLWWCCRAVTPVKSCCRCNKHCSRDRQRWCSSQYGALCWVYTVYTQLTTLHGYQMPEHQHDNLVVHMDTCTHIQYKSKLYICAYTWWLIMLTSWACIYLKLRNYCVWPSEEILLVYNEHKPIGHFHGWWRCRGIFDDFEPSSCVDFLFASFLILITKRHFIT